MARLFSQHLAIYKNVYFCTVALKIFQSKLIFLQKSPNKPTKNHKLYEILPKWQNFAKSDLTGERRCQNIRSLLQIQQCLHCHCVKLNWCRRGAVVGAQLAERFRDWVQIRPSANFVNSLLLAYRKLYSLFKTSSFLFRRLFGRFFVCTQKLIRGCKFNFDFLVAQFVAVPKRLPV